MPVYTQAPSLRNTRAHVHTHPSVVSSRCPFQESSRAPQLSCSIFVIQRSAQQSGAWGGGECLSLAFGEAETLEEETLELWAPRSVFHRELQWSCPRDGRVQEDRCPGSQSGSYSLGGIGAWKAAREGMGFPGRPLLSKVGLLSVSQSCSDTRYTLCTPFLPHSLPLLCPLQRQDRPGGVCTVF